MRPSIKIALLFAVIWFAGKLILFYSGTFQDESGVKFLVMWNILCLLMGMSIGTLIEKRRENRSESTALADIKSILGSGLIYSVVVAGLIYMYYAKIDPGYNQRQLAVAEAAARKMVDDPKEFARVKREHPDLASKTREEILELALANQEATFSAGSTMTLSLLGMLVLSTINSIVLTVVFRRVLFRQGTF